MNKTSSKGVIKRPYHIEGMQNNIDPEGTAKEIWEMDQERRRLSKEEIDASYNNRLAPDSEEQLRYNAVVESILDYNNYNEYKYKTSFKYKILKMFKLTK